MSSYGLLCCSHSARGEARDGRSRRQVSGFESMATFFLVSLSDQRVDRYFALLPNVTQIVSAETSFVAVERFLDGIVVCFISTARFYCFLEIMRRSLRTNAVRTSRLTITI